jgi:hypothetical protein
MMPGIAVFCACGAWAACPVACVTIVLSIIRGEFASPAKAGALKDKAPTMATVMAVRVLVLRREKVMISPMLFQGKSHKACIP